MARKVLNLSFELTGYPLSRFQMFTLRVQVDPGIEWSGMGPVRITSMEAILACNPVQRDPQNDWTATQRRVNCDVFVLPPFVECSEM